MNNDDERFARAEAVETVREELREQGVLTPTEAAYLAGVAFGIRNGAVDQD